MTEKLTKRDIEVTKKNPYFEMQGISHTAYVSGDMAKTVEFYQDKLGMELVMGMEAPARDSTTGEIGFQHFFFDCGNGDTIGFVWMESSELNPAPRGPGLLPPPGYAGTIHHIAIKVPEEKFVEYTKLLTEKGIEYQMIIHDIDESLGSTIDDIKDTTFAASVYFPDPDGIIVEFCSWLPAVEKLGRGFKGMARKQLAETTA